MFSNLLSMREKTKADVIGLLGPWGSGNLGDAAIQDAVMFNIKQRLPEVALVGFSHNPQDTLERHGLACFPINRRSNYRNVVSSNRTARPWGDFPDGFMRLLALIEIPTKKLRAVVWILRELISEVAFLIRSYGILKRVNLLIISGGGQLDDYYGGAWGHPYTLFCWMVLTRLTGTRLVVLSVGECQMEAGLTKWFLKKVLGSANYVSFRDQGSKDAILSIGMGREGPVVPDLAFSLPIANNVRSSHGLIHQPAIGISPISAFAWQKERDADYEQYLLQLVMVVEWLTQENYRVVFFCSQKKMDYPVVQELRGLLHERGLSREHLISERETPSVQDLLSCIQAMDLVVASRLHGVLLSHVMSKPVIAVSYHRKVRRHMEDIGQAHNCLDVQEFDIESFRERFRGAYSSRQLISQHIRKTISEYTVNLNRQYDLVLGVPGREDNLGSRPGAMGETINA
jgi:polysaccharide pyruvyl transferase WcaK-like protein